MKYIKIIYIVISLIGMYFLIDAIINLNYSLNTMYPYSPSGLPSEYEPEYSYYSYKRETLLTQIFWLKWFLCYVFVSTFLMIFLLCRNWQSVTSSSDKIKIEADF
jgi:hypothetical protein